MSNTELSLLSIREGQVAFDAEQKKAIIDTLRVHHATDADMAVFFHMCQRTRLDPFRRQIYMIARKEWNPETRTSEYRQTFQTGIDGYRVIAERDARKRGVALKKARFRYWDDEGQEHDAWWKSEPPAMIRATVQMGDDEPVIWDARYTEYVPLKDEYEDVLDGQGKPVKENGRKVTRATGKKVPQGLWATRPTAQLEKCAEAGALRRACPEDLSNLFVDAEMERADVVGGTTLVDDGADTETHDWVAEAAVAEDSDELREIWRKSAARGEKTHAVMAAIRKRTVELRESGEMPAEQPEQPAQPEAGAQAVDTEGEPIEGMTEEQVSALADEAEQGYDPENIQEQPREESEGDPWSRPADPS